MSVLGVGILESRKSFGPIEAYWMVFRRWRIVLSIIILGVGAVMLNVMLETPQYSSTVELILDPRDKKVVESETVLSGLGRDAVTIASEVRVIRSSAIAERVIRDLNLTRDPEFNPVLRKSSFSFASLFGWFGKKAQARTSDRLDNSLTVNQLNEMSKRLSKKVNARRVGKTFIIAVTFTSENPEKSARIANKLADAYLVSQLEAKFQATKRANQWLNSRLASLQEKLQESEKAVELYIAQHNLIGTKGKTPFEAEHEKLNEKLILARIELNEKSTQYQQAREILRKRGRLSSIEVLARSEEIIRLRHERAKLAKEEAELIALFTKRHPKVVSKRGERRDLERQIEAEAGKIVGSLRTSYYAAKKKVDLIKQNINQLKGKTQGERNASIRLRELQREADANKAVYESFLNRFKQTSEQETLSTANSRVITEAIPSKVPSAPNKKRAFVLALIGFSACGMVVAFVIEYLNNNIKSSHEIEEVLKTSHLSSIPNLSPADCYHEGQKIPMDRYAVMRPLTPFAEAMRTLKVGLELSNLDNPPKIILMTSVFPNEGKTTTCANFAQHAAQVGTRTLAIDADLRNPSLTKRLVKNPQAGLIELLSNQVSIDQAIIRDHTSMDILPGRSIPYNSAEILRSESMKNHLMQLKQMYDLIVIDSSPVMPVIDAKVLVNAVDAVVVIAEWDKTPQDAVEAVLDSLDPDRKKIAGVVLNKVDLKQMRSYSYNAIGYKSYYGKSLEYYGGDS